MTFLALIVALLAFASFALSTDAHALARLQVRPTPAARRNRRAGAWTLLGIAFTLAVADYGWVFGPVVWTGTIMFAAGAVFLSLNLLPSKQRNR